VVHLKQQLLGPRVCQMKSSGGLYLERAAWIIFLSVLTVSVLLFGAVHAYAYTFAILGILLGSLLLLVCGIQSTPGRRALTIRLPLKGPGVFFGFFLLYVVLQTVPLPASWTAYLSPETFLSAEKSIYPAPGTRSVDGYLSWLPLAPYGYPVRMSIIRFSAYILFFFGLVQVLNSRKRLEITIFLLLGIGCFEVLYGFFQIFSGSGRIWWFGKTTYHSLKDVTGTYINRNHLAGLLDMLLVLAAAYALSLSGEKTPEPAWLGQSSPLRRWLYRWLSAGEQWNKLLLIFFLGILMGIGLIFSASRGGMIAAAAALLCMGALFFFRKAHKRRGIIFLLLFAATVLYAIHIGAEYPLERFNRFSSDFEVRSRYARKTMDLFKDYPVAGVGIGNFQYAYPKYQSREDNRLFIRYAHNDWAQFMAEAGLAGLVCLLGGGAFWIYRTFRFWQSRSDPFSVGLGILPFGAMTAMAIHEFSDFNLHIPANFLMLMAILAIGHSALHLQSHRHGDCLALRQYTLPMMPKGFLLLLILSGFILWNGVWTVRHFIAESYCNTVKNSTFNRDPRPPAIEVEQAISWDRGNAEYQYKLAMAHKRNNETDGKIRAATAGAATQKDVVRAMEKAVRLNPFQRTYHLRLGWEYAYMWLEEPNAHQKWLLAADTAMARAAYYTGEAFVDDHLEIGNYWLMRSKTVADNSPEWWTAWNKAKWHYRQSIAMEKGLGKHDRVEKIRNEIKAHYSEESFVDRVLGAAGRAPE
jgi:O-antigen ligase